MTYVYIFFYMVKLWYSLLAWTALGWLISRSSNTWVKNPEAARQVSLIGGAGTARDPPETHTPPAATMESSKKFI